MRRKGESTVNYMLELDPLVKEWEQRGLTEFGEILSDLSSRSTWPEIMVFLNALPLMSPPTSNSTLAKGIISFLRELKAADCPYCTDPGLTLRQLTPMLRKWQPTSAYLLD